MVSFDIYFGFNFLASSPNESNGVLQIVQTYFSMLGST